MIRSAPDGDGSLRDDTLDANVEPARIRRRRGLGVQDVAAATFVTERFT
jgi:hypothetical protein